MSPCHVFISVPIAIGIQEGNLNGFFFVKSAPGSSLVVCSCRSCRLL